MIIKFPWTGEKKFISAPGKVNELLKRKDVQEAIKKGEQYLGL